jgi:hypothetical protein
MNPKPLLALNHFTVPCSFNCVSLFILSYLVLFPTASSQKKDRKCGLAVPSTILKVLQEQQTHPYFRTLPPLCPLNFRELSFGGEKVSSRSPMALRYR